MLFNKVSLLSFFAASFLIAGCASPGVNAPELPTIRKSRAEREPAVFNGVIATAADEIARTVVAISTESPPYFNICTGTLVTPDLTLTAAHCLVDENGKRTPGPTRVYFGLSFNFDKKLELKKGEIIEPQNIAVLNKYNPTRKNGSEDNDLALLKLSTPVAAGYIPAKIMTKQEPTFRGLQFIVAGYSVFNSQFEEASAKPYTLRYMRTLFKRDSMDRPGYFGNTAKSISIENDREHAFSHGDSGGPCFAATSSGIKLWGVIHGGIPGDNQWCTPIFRYMPWLVKAAKALSADRFE